MQYNFFYFALTIHIIPYIVTATPQIFSWVLGRGKKQAKLKLKYKDNNNNLDLLFYNI